MADLEPETDSRACITEEAPGIDTTFAVPEALLGRHPRGAELLAKGSVCRTTVLGLETGVCVFAFNNSALAAKRWARLTVEFSTTHRAVVATTGSGDYMGPVMVTREPAIEKIFIGDDREHLQSLYQGLARVDMEVAGRFSRITGFRVRYCFGSNFILPPYPYEQDVLNLFISSRPPGNFAHFNQPIGKLFGYNVWPDGEVRMVNGPVSWRGRVLASEGVPVFQVLGNNVYHLAMVLSAEGNNLDRTKIMEKLLSQLLLARAEVSEDVHEATVESYERDVRSMAEQRSSSLRLGFDRIDTELRELERRLAMKLREHRNQVACLQALEREMPELVDRITSDFGKIRAMPDVASLRTHAENGVLVETVPIVFERDGRRYDLGPFFIHVALEGQVAVWSEAPKHPNGHHHPHIDKTSLECFGNITLAVHKYIAAYRLAETIELVLRWIRTYNPDLTLIPLEEFPSEPVATKGTARETKRHTELLGAAQPARSANAAAGDPDRRRLDRQPRRLRSGQDGSAKVDRVGRRQRKRA